MLGRLFPRSLDQNYQGWWLAVWLLTPVLAAKTLMGLNFSGLNPLVDVGEILRSVDGVPLDTFEQAAVAAVMDSAAAWGAALFTLCLFAWIALVRYRAALPLAILFLIVEQVGRTGPDTFRAASALITGSTALSAGAIINLAMTVLLLAALAFSLLKRRSVGSSRP